MIPSEDPDYGDRGLAIPAGPARPGADLDLCP